MPLLYTGIGSADSDPIPLVPGQRYQFHFCAGAGIDAGSLALQQVDAELAIARPSNPHLETFPDNDPSYTEPVAWDLASIGEGVRSFIAVGRTALVSVAGATGDKTIVYHLVPILR